jgi:predicted nuclease with TOPRIM domain
VAKFIPVEPEKWGEMVQAWAENPRLKAEVERLQKEQRLKAIPVEAKLIDRLAELKAEVERLTKAGDDLVLQVEWRNVVIVDPPSLSFFKVSPDCLCNCHNFDKVIEAWNAAKEGKQP